MAQTQAQKINEAANYIDASMAADGNGYIYRADETDEWYRITASELIDLSDLMHDSDPDIRRDAYSHWCSASGTRIGSDDDARRAGLIDA